MHTIAEDLAVGPHEIGDGPSRRPAATADLVRRGRLGDREALEELITAHERMVLRTALRLLGSPDRAQDAAQEAFLRLFRYLGRFDESRELGPWLYRVVVNVCRDLARKSAAARWVSFDDAAEPIAERGGQREMEDTIQRREQRRLVQEALMTLPEKERAALVLRDLEGLSTAEVAHILGSTQGTVRSQVSTARVKIRRLILRDRGASE